MIVCDLPEKYEALYGGNSSRSEAGALVERAGRVSRVGVIGLGSYCLTDRR